MTPAPHTTWTEVMQGLTGLRLAVHDQLLQAGALDVATLVRLTESRAAIAELTAAVEWLAKHRLLVCEEGKWRAVAPGLARVQWEMSGPSALPTDEPKPARPAERGETVAVHRHQKEFFTSEGYREANGSIQ